MGDTVKAIDQPQPSLRVSMLLDQFVTLALLLGFLVLYMRTAAPSVLSGDSAEFQFAAPLLGVPHPTTYPLYVLLGKLATLIVPFGDMARRVTLVSVGCAALAVALFFLLARRLSAATPAAAISALALGTAPGLWNAATLAEVYALLLALLTGLGYLLATSAERRTTNDERRAPSDKRQALNDDSSLQAVPSSPRSPAHPLTRSPTRWYLRAAALLTGLGCTHHGLFVIIGLPLFIAYVAWYAFIWRLPLKQLAILALCFGVGLSPWLYPLIQFARYGPFNGDDYGLPVHYFWGSPVSWAATLDLLTGGTVRRGIFRAPSVEASLAVLRMVGSRLLFEFGPIGMLLGMLGCAAMALRQPRAWLSTAWVFLITLFYLLLLGPAVEDAPVFTLPMLLPWSLWIAAGITAIIAMVRRRTTNDRQPTTQILHSPFYILHSVVVLLFVATLAWGYSRLPYSNKRHLWLFRQFGAATLERLSPNAVVMAHWEQGTTLQYMVLVERMRPDVWVDIVEPGDDAWGLRAQRRYAGRTVFFVGAPSDVAGLPVELVREDQYADLFKLRK